MLRPHEDSDITESVAPKVQPGHVAPGDLPSSTSIGENAWESIQAGGLGGISGSLPAVIDVEGDRNGRAIATTVLIDEASALAPPPLTHTVLSVGSLLSSSRTLKEGPFLTSPWHSHLLTLFPNHGKSPRLLEGSTTVHLR